MKHYWSIPGARYAPKGLPCIAFDKLDGSNIRAEWSKKNGWYKFGTRRQMLDETNTEFGQAIPLFLNKYGDSIPKVLHDKKEYRGVEECVVFFEFYGENSFAGYHDYSQPFDVILLDVCPYKKGVVGPRQFIKHFSHLHIPAVIYEGNFNQQFIRAVREGKYPVKEGTVVKGNKPNGKYPHNFWCAKVKTNWWLEELKRRAEYIEELRLVLEENLREQSDE